MFRGKEDSTLIEGKLSRIVAVKVTLYNENSNIVFSESKNLTVLKKELHIALKFNPLKTMDYFDIIEFLDKISNEGDFFKRNKTLDLVGR